LKISSSTRSFSSLKTEKHGSARFIDSCLGSISLHLIWIGSYRDEEMRFEAAGDRHGIHESGTHGTI